jgi:hypothetical protein
MDKKSGEISMTSNDQNPYAAQRQAIDGIIAGKQALRDLGVIRSERMIGEIGEWFVELLLGGSRAESTPQSGYDIVLGQKRIQVKTHAKGDNNNARWTAYHYPRGAFDELIIVVFTKELFLKEFYRLPKTAAYEDVDRTKKQHVVKWDHLKQYQVALEDLPNQPLVNAFKDPGE